MQDTVTVINHTLVDDVDSFIAAVAGGDTAETGQWSRASWQMALNAYHAFSDTPWPAWPTLAPVPGLPEWFRAVLDGRSRPDTETPAPTLCRIDADPRDWFDLAAEHPDDLQLWACTPTDGPTITLEQITAAWSATIAAGATPLLGLCVEPLIDSEDIRFVANLEAFYTVDTDGSGTGAAAAEAAFGWAGRAEPYFFETEAQVLQEAGLTSGRVTSWEWLGLCPPIEEGHAA